MSEEKHLCGECRYINSSRCAYPMYTEPEDYVCSRFVEKVNKCPRCGSVISGKYCIVCGYKAVSK